MSIKSIGLSGNCTMTDFEIGSKLYYSVVEFTGKKTIADYIFTHFKYYDNDTDDEDILVLMLFKYVYDQFVELCNNEVRNDKCISSNKLYTEWVSEIQQWSCYIKMKNAIDNNKMPWLVVDIGRNSELDENPKLGTIFAMAVCWAFRVTDHTGFDQAMSRLVNSVESCDLSENQALGLFLLCHNYSKKNIELLQNAVDNINSRKYLYSTPVII